MQCFQSLFGSHPNACQNQHCRPYGSGWAPNLWNSGEVYNDGYVNGKMCLYYTHFCSKILKTYLNIQLTVISGWNKHYWQWNTNYFYCFHTNYDYRADYRVTESYFRKLPCIILLRPQNTWPQSMIDDLIISLHHIWPFGQENLLFTSVNLLGSSALHLRVLWNMRYNKRSQNLVESSL